MRLADELLEGRWQVSPSLGFELDNLQKALDGMIEGLASVRNDGLEERIELVEERQKNYLERTHLLRNFYEELQEQSTQLNCEHLIGKLEEMHRQPWFTMLLRTKLPEITERIRDILSKAYLEIGQRPKFHQTSFKQVSDEVLRQVKEKDGKVDRKLLQQLDQHIQELYSERHFGRLEASCREQLTRFVMQLLQSFPKMINIVDSCIFGRAQQPRVDTYQTQLKDTVEDLDEPPYLNKQSRMHMNLVTTPMKLLASPHGHPDRILKSANRSHY